MTQFLHTERTWNLPKLRHLILPRKKTFRLIVVIGFICGLIFIENVKQYNSVDSRQYKEKDSHISFGGRCFPSLLEKIFSPFHSFCLVHMGEKTDKPL